MSENVGIQIDKIISKVKKAIREVEQQSYRSELGVKVEKLDLKLKTFNSKEGGLELKVPVVDLDLGLGGSISKEETHTIELTLIPVDDTRLFGEEDIEDNLVELIMGIEQGIKNALVDAPRFKLQKASVELNFVVNAGGEISIVAKGEKEIETTNNLKLYLTSAESVQVDSPTNYGASLR
ncbi:trypco2 family protein [Methanosarcina sp. T3]|uniref:trypco2 family protein n=1 Tax=Methanosarcina sp. T3 TaxID=3439062 RepID=UPI003F873FD5